MTAQQVPPPTVAKKEVLSEQGYLTQPAELTSELLAPKVNPLDTLALSKRTIRWMHDPKRKRSMWAKK